MYLRIQILPLIYFTSELFVHLFTAFNVFLLASVLFLSIFVFCWIFGDIFFLRGEKKQK